MTHWTKFNRRQVSLALATSLVFGSGGSAVALSKGEADKLIQRLVSEVNSAIAKTQSLSAMFKEFERIFGKYADVPLIARKALGPTWRTASDAQRKAYVVAFRGYMARYYGKQFEKFRGGEIVVGKSKKVSGGFLVDSKIKLKGSAPFKAQWFVIDARGKSLMYNMFIEGVSILSDVRTQIGSMLDKRGGDINKLTAHLRTAG